MVDSNLVHNYLIKFQLLSFEWRTNVAALDDHFAQHISRFPEHLAKNPQYKNPILFIGGSKSDYLT